MFVGTQPDSDTAMPTCPPGSTSPFATPSPKTSPISCSMAAACIRSSIPMAAASGPSPIGSAASPSCSPSDSIRRHGSRMRTRSSKRRSMCSTVASSRRATAPPAQGGLRDKASGARQMDLRPKLPPDQRRRYPRGRGRRTRPGDARILQPDPARQCPTKLDRRHPSHDGIISLSMRGARPGRALPAQNFRPNWTVNAFCDAAPESWPE